MIKRAIWTVAMILIGYGLGQTFDPPKAGAGSVDNIVFELQQLRQAAQDIAHKMDCR